MSILAIIYMAITPSLAKRYSTKWIYYAWLFIVIGLIIPFRPSFGNAAIQIDVPQYNSITPQAVPPPVSTTDNTGAATVNDNNANVELVQDPIVPEGNAATIPWPTILVAVWLAGVMIVLACHVIRHKRFIRSVWRWGEDVTDSKTLDIWQAVRKDMNVTAQIGLQRSEMTGSPLLTGILYPRIMLPKADIPDEDMALILKHELVHFTRKDLWYKGLVLFAVALHWFNPMIYIIAKTISQHCERSCDDEVIKYKDSDSRFRYSEAIIHSIRYAESTTALSTNFFGGKKEMKDRISSIMDMSRKRRGAIIICATLTLTLITGLAFAVNVATKPEDIDELPAIIINDEQESLSIVGQWSIIRDAISTERDGSLTPGNYNPEFDPLYMIEIYTDSTFYKYCEWGSIKGTIIQSGTNEYTITNIFAPESETAAYSKYPDEAQWLSYDPESGLLCHIAYSHGEEIYSHQYYERVKVPVLTASGVLCNHETHDIAFLYLDDNGSYLMEVTTPCGMTYLERISEDIYYKTMTSDCSSGICSWGTWYQNQNNNFWCFRNCTECGALQLAVHCHTSCETEQQYSPFCGYDPGHAELNNADIVYNHIFAPEDIYDLVHVDLVIEKGDTFWSAGFSDANSLLWLERYFGSAEKAEYDLGCPSWSALYMRRSDGASGVIYVSMDCCKTFRSGDTQYTWGTGDNKAFYVQFGSTDFEPLILEPKIPPVNIGANLEDVVIDLSHSGITTEILEDMIVRGDIPLDTIILYLQGNMINDISSLRYLEKLKLLLINNNQITDITGIESLTKLEWLDLSDNQISDITPLRSLKNLAVLDISFNEISETLLEKLKDALPNCEVFS